MANVSALKGQAAKLVVKGNYAKALQIYEKVKEMDPDEPGIYNLIGDVYLKMRQKDNAVTQFKEALEMYIKVQYYPNAIAVCKKILRTDKEQTEVYNDLADLYVERGFIGEAVINYLEYASRMRKEGNKQKEIEAYRKVIELGPSKVDIRERLVDLYVAEGEKEAAIEELERIEELLIQQGKQSKLPEIEEKLAALKIEMMSLKEKKEEEPTGTEEEGKDLIIRQGFTMEDMMQAGATVTEKPIEKVEKEKKEAKKKVHVEEEVSLEDEIAKIQASSVGSKGEPVTVENLPPPDKSDLQSAPTQWTNFEELAELCLSVNSKNEAIDYLYKAGQMYLEENNYAKAIRTYKKIIDIRPLELRPRQKLIEISLKSQDKETAAQWNFDLGQCLFRKGASEEAEKAFGRALDLTSKKDKLKKNIEQIHGKAKEEKKAKKKKEKVTKVETPSISLGDLLKEEEKKAVKFTVAEDTQVDEPITFEDLLEEFKEGVLENIEDTDFDSHYDLGITYKEMGLLEEAILEFEKASRGEAIKLKSIEILALCLMEKGDIAEAEKIVKEVLLLKGHKDVEFLGLKYNLAGMYERINKNNEATQLFKEILSVDIEFQDTLAKLKELQERTGKHKVAKKEEKPKKVEKRPAKAATEKKAKKEKPKEVVEAVGGKKKEPARETVKAKKEKPKEKMMTKRKKKISYI
ncbi:MAG: tetratricopeptide repeat protein [Candidatus Cloacimonadota bacterium]|nr:MAG: tetratricopeptide repeat protein [Candidatus Cloacimonadota bacterium]